MRFMLFASLAWVVTACGEPRDPDVSYGPPADPKFEEVRPVVAANCGKCHNGVKHPLDFSKAGVFKASKAKARLTAGTMPPAPATISDADKATLLAYLGG